MIRILKATTKQRSTSELMSRLADRLVILTVCLVLAVGAAGFAQESPSSLVAQFENGDAEAKAIMLRQISSEPASGVEPVYLAALGDALSPSDAVRTNAQYRELVLHTVRRLGEAESTEGLDDLWRLFVASRDKTLRIPVFLVLGDIGSQDAQTFSSITGFLLSQNALDESEARIDTQVMYAATDDLIEAVTAAVRLSRYLEPANTYTEYDRPYDTRLMVEALEALRRIGCGVAHDDIYYTTLLDYPTIVLESARDALATVSQ